MENQEKALDIFKAIEDKQGEAASYSNLGSTYCALGQYEKSLMHLQNALEVCKEICVVRGQLRSYRSLASVYHLQGQLEKSIVNYKKVLEISREIGDRQEEESIQLVQCTWEARTSCHLPREYTGDHERYWRETTKR